MKKIQFTETVLRDGQQSLIATRMPTSDMLPILKTMDQQAIMPWKCGAARPSMLVCVF